MNKYIILTTEGFTEDPHGIVTENMQVLGYAQANSKSEAIDLLWKTSNSLNYTQFSKEWACAIRIHDEEAI